MCNKNKPFFIKKGNRAMVSLGPFTERKHCPFSCAFCYVQDGFCSYEKYKLEDIVDFLKENRANYNIIYISGDTDSFAAPRTDEGIQLLEMISKEIDCDLLFTTRTTFNENQYEKLREIASNQNSKNKHIFGCISITRYSKETEYLEPFPIPKPSERIAVLKKLHEIGIITVLAMRPFLPVVSIDDYIKLLDLSHGFVDIALGEHFYFMDNDKIEKRVFINGISSKYKENISKDNSMDFDFNDKKWNIWYSPYYEKMVAKKCEQLDIVFSMHSTEAINKYLSNLNES